MNTILSIISNEKWSSSLIFMIVLLSPWCTLAQTSEGTSVILLKKDTGLVEIHGNLTPAKDSDKIAVRTGEGNVWLFPRSAVDSIYPEEPVLSLTKNSWYNTTTLGVYFGDDNGYQVQSTIGYRFHYRYYTGIGVALDHYTIRTLPVFVDLRADLRKEKTSPFAYADAGLANPWPTRSQYELQKEPDKRIPGLYLNAGIGWRFRSREGSNSWQVSVGYSLETMKLRYIQPIADPGLPDLNDSTPEVQVQTFEYTFNRFVIKAGFTL